ncbi:MAG: type I DNA topoisomerase [Bacteroidota bacterium]|nr:type I DNA topoisomerase [Bacteroidota bacterium]MEC8239397.1 type I DNA topoisomerase [Bacteroidota bacterium]
MAKNLVIVESPAKAKTIEKYLGADFKVVSSYGHISDLPDKELGVDVERNFMPKYTVSSDKKKLVSELKTLARKSNTVWLASDEDREGEAIAWHLSNVLELQKENTKRIVFNEITKTAIQHAIEHPRQIDQNLVDAQQARRVLDRLVGYELSPILWRKVQGGLSAGRVQSVTLRLVVEREREIENFVPKETFKVQANFTTAEGCAFTAELSKTFSSEQESLDFLNQNIEARFHINSIEKKPATKAPAAPFTTSTLQQEASRKLGFSVSRTMQNAQRLYEAGLITYMRTDSVNLSKQALEQAASVIESNYGKQYVQTHQYVTKKKGAQEAHEAIRPTDLNLIEANVEYDQKRLYDLIWKRTLASQMSMAKLERTVAKIVTDKHSHAFVARGEVVVFDGFLKLYLEGVDDPADEDQSLLPAMEKGELAHAKQIVATQRFSRPPYRYSEASLVKKLEELGIGRPSTYAPTISTVLNRKYVAKGTHEGDQRTYKQLLLKDNKLTTENKSEKTGSQKGKLVPTDIGFLVNDFLINNFKDIVDYGFTASIEQDFDRVATGNSEWESIMKQFYSNFHPVVEDVKKNATRETGQRILGVDPKTGRQLSVRLGKFGPMAQVGTVDDEEKPLFASIPETFSLAKITFEEALDLFKLPATIGEYEGLPVQANNGRYGPYLIHNKVFVSLPKGTDPLTVTLEKAISFIEQKRKDDAPIATYEGQGVTKGKGRFGPFIKWNGWFINVSKKYDFNDLSEKDIEELIEAKKKKEAERVVRVWEDEGIRIEKARWGRHNLIKGKTKVELNKTTDVANMTLDQATEMLSKKKPAKKKKK